MPHTLFQFQRVFVEITNICNLHCTFCAGTERTPKYMDESLFARIMREVQPTTTQLSFHVLGEPLLHPKLQVFLEMAAAANFAVNITTNGTLLSSHPEVLHPAVRQINFSLQALEHPAGFDRQTLDNILAFAHHATRVRPDLYINFRLWNHPSRDFAENQHNTAILKSICEHLHVPFPEITIGRKSRNLIGRIYLHLDTIFDWPCNADAQESTHGYCHALSTHFAILVDGTVCPCCLDANGSLALGNINQQSLTDILQSPRAVAMHTGFQHRRLVESLCRTCTYCRRFNTKQVSRFHTE